MVDTIASSDGVRKVCCPDGYAEHNSALGGIYKKGSSFCTKWGSSIGTESVRTAMIRTQIYGTERHHAYRNCTQPSTVSVPSFLLFY